MKVTWKDGMAFEAIGNSGVAFTMDSHVDFGGRGLGPSPVEALMGSIAACSAMDVISILQKKKQDVTGYEIYVTGDRGPEGVFPRPFTRFTVRHVVTGVGLDDAAVARAVQLSDEKYCTVMATLREAPEMVSEYEVRDSAAV